MNKLYMLLLVCLVLVPFVSASNITTMPVNINITVDFTGERDFTIFLPNGGERHYSWEPNQTHSDTTFTHTFYYSFDEDIYCVLSNYKIKNYEDITGSVADLLDVCTLSMQTYNKSQEYQTRLTAAEVDMKEFESLYKIETNRRQTLENESNECKNKLSSQENQLVSCQSESNGYSTCKTDLNAVREDLDDSEKSKNTTMIISAIAGLGVGYFLWGKKMKGGPSEQADSGSTGDNVDYRESFNFK